MRKLHILCIALASFLLMATTAFAFGEIRYPDRPLNLRNKRSAKGKWVGSLYPGQKVRVAYMKDGWVAIFEPNETRNTLAAAVGYSNAKYLLKKRTRHEPKEWGKVVFTSRTLNIRNKASRKGKRVGQLKSMDHVKIDFPDGDWSRVFSLEATIRSEMGGMGYSSTKYFEPATKKSMAKAGIGKKSAVASPPAPKPVAVEKPAPVKPEPSKFELVSIKKIINVRLSRTSSSPLVTTLNPGDRVKIGLLRSGWYAIFKEDATVLSESVSLGYALESLMALGSEPASAVPPQSKSEVKQSITPAPAPKPEPEPAPVSTPEVKPAPAPPAKAEPAKAAVAPKPVAPTPAPKPVASTPAPKKSSKQQSIVIDRKAFAGKKRPDPVPNKSAHGYEYKLLEKSEARQLGEPWIILKVFLATNKEPNRKALQDFATTLWKEHRRATKKVAVLVYLPGMDIEDLSYGVVKFSDKKFEEIWVRKATLFGTDFF